MVNSITILLLILSVSSFAQISVGIKAGANLNHTVRTLDPFPFRILKGLPGFTLAFTERLNLVKNFFYEFRFEKLSEFARENLVA